MRDCGTIDLGRWIMCHGPISRFSLASSHIEELNKTAVRHIIAHAGLQLWGGALKMLDVKMTDVKLTDQCAGHEIAGHEIAGHENAGHEMDMK